MSRNSRPNFAAFAAEEERRRANEAAANRPRHDVADMEGAGAGVDLGPGLTSKIRSAIRRAFGR
jgi:hypothetical protein